MNIIWEWIPNFSLGSIKLGDKIDAYVETFHLIKEEEEDHDDITNWISYDFPNMDAYVDAENGIIVNITTYEEFLYKGENIIGSTVNQVRSLLGCDPDEVGSAVLYDDGDIQTPFTYTDLGLLLWVRDTKVVYVSCTNYETPWLTRKAQ